MLFFAIPELTQWRRCYNKLPPARMNFSRGQRYGIGDTHESVADHSTCCRIADWRLRGAFALTYVDLGVPSPAGSFVAGRCEVEVARRMIPATAALRLVYDPTSAPEDRRRERIPLARGRSRGAKLQMWIGRELL